MQDTLYFTSKEMKKLLSLSDCHLMHEREKGNLSFIKKGNQFLYEVDDQTLVSKHELAAKVINWYQNKHEVDLDNSPTEEASIKAIALLLKEILIPINDKFGEVKISYGFVSSQLNTYIQKNNRTGTYPSIDQHSSHELNSKSIPICDRGGIACDFYISGFENKMNIITDDIVSNLEFDKLYYYGSTRPIHVSVSKEMLKHLQIMNESENGRRIPGKKAYGDEAASLAKELLK
ncbi:hypothetical protein [Neptunicella sp.]|uniref:hypothetical protein n=1 Tax=Neptunicella sp. TaxID=2125986 RepID=UPI003F691FB0